MRGEHEARLTPEHMTAFGYITHNFAIIEVMIQSAAAGILNTDLATAMILMGDAGY